MWQHFEWIRNGLSIAGVWTLWRCVVSLWRWVIGKYDAAIDRILAEYQGGFGQMTVALLSETSKRKEKLVRWSLTRLKKEGKVEQPERIAHPELWRSTQRAKEIDNKVRDWRGSSRWQS
jgi:hypothetical protein